MMDIETFMMDEIPKFKKCRSSKERVRRNYIIHLAHDVGGMTQTEIARMSGLSRSRVGQIVKIGRWLNSARLRAMAPSMEKVKASK